MCINPLSNMLRKSYSLLIKIKLPAIFENNFKTISFILKCRIAQKRKIKLIFHTKQIQTFWLFFIPILEHFEQTHRIIRIYHFLNKHLFFWNTRVRTIREGLGIVDTTCQVARWLEITLRLVFWYAHWVFFFLIILQLLAEFRFRD